MGNIKGVISNDEMKKIGRYIIKPAWITFLISCVLIAVGVLILLLLGKFEAFIVSMNVKYNSPLLIGLVFAFAIVLLGAVGYGVFLSLHKYRRPNGKGFLHVTYPNGTSYQTFAKAIDRTRK